MEDKLEVSGTTEVYPYYTNRMPSYYSGNIQNVTDEEFAVLLGHPIPDGHFKGELGINDALIVLGLLRSKKEKEQ